VNRFLPVVLLLLAIIWADTSAAQDSSAHESKIHFYFGGSLHASIVQDLESAGFGLGAEVGFLIDPVYFGGEWGFVSISSGQGPGSAGMLVPGYIPPDGPGSGHFYGIHGGVVVTQVLWLGIELMNTYGDYTHYFRTTQFEYATTTLSYKTLSIGPDIRLHTGRRTLLDFAYCYASGFKFGINYVL